MGATDHAVLYSMVKKTWSNLHGLHDRGDTSSWSNHLIYTVLFLLLAQTEGS